MRYRLQRHDGTDCSATMVPITVLRMVPIQRYRQLMATTHLKKPYSSLYSLLENEKTRYVRKYINRYLYYQYPLIVSGIARPRKKHLSQLHGMPPSRLNNNKRSEKPDHNINYKNVRKLPCYLPTQIQATL